MDWTLLGKNPISADAKAGTDAKYDPVFIALQEEIDKLASPSATEGADWKKISTLSSEVLSGKSKDILVASYFAVSQIYLDQMKGLEIGLKVYHDLIATFWEELFPPVKRMKGRINAVDWWLEKTENALMMIKPPPVPQEMIEGIAAELNAIEAELNSRLPSPISVKSILRVLDAFKVQVPVKKEAPPTPPPSQPPQPQPKSDPPTQTEAPIRVISKSPSVPAAPDEISSFSDAEKVMSSGFKAIEKAARFHFSSGVESPLSYRYTRIAIWGGVEALPVVTDGNKTIIPAPDAHFIDTVQGLMLQGDLKNLVDVAESKVSEYIFWIDLHYFIVKALSGLGIRYESAKAAVVQETAFFIHRFPELPSLLFADGTPFANSETQSWVRTISLSGASAMGDSLTVSPPPVSDFSGDEVDLESKKAFDLVKNNKLPEAVDLIQGRLRQSGSMREMFLWRVALAQALMNGSRIEIALPHLDRILSDTEAFQLERWEPALALCGLKIVHFGYRAHPDPDVQKQAEEVLNRIVLLDARAAL